MIDNKFIAYSVVKLEKRFRFGVFYMVDSIKMICKMRSMQTINSTRIDNGFNGLINFFIAAGKSFKYAFWIICFINIVRAVHYPVTFNAAKIGNICRYFINNFNNAFICVLRKNKFISINKSHITTIKFILLYCLIVGWHLHS